MDELDTREWVDQVVAGLPYARALSGGLGFAAAIPRARISRLGYRAVFFQGLLYLSLYLYLYLNINICIYSINNKYTYTDIVCVDSGLSCKQPRAPKNLHLELRGATGPQM